MSQRQLPVRPDLTQLKHQAKDLLKELRRADPGAKLADAQHALAREYGAPSWARIVQCCELVDAIWRDQPEAVRRMVTTHPNLLHENAGIRNNNWGPPLSYAANLGRDRVIDVLVELGARDLAQGMDRAILQGRIGTARKLHALLGRPAVPKDALGSPAYTLSVTGTELLFELGARVYDDDGAQLAAPDVVITSDSRRPAAKHAILELYARHGFRFADTAVIALHRGRIDLLEDHLRRDPAMLRRIFTHEEIFPPEWGCRGVVDTTGTPIAGGTLLHMCIDWDEVEIAEWLLAKGADPNAPAAVDAAGFGGHTPLFNAVVSWAHFWANFDRYGPPGRADDGVFARMLLDRGADPAVRASLRREPHPGKVYEHRDATPLEWAEAFPDRMLVSRRAVEMLRNPTRRSNPA